jgi:hypothetical protein
MCLIAAHALQVGRKVSDVSIWRWAEMAQRSAYARSMAEASAGEKPSEAAESQAQ